MMKSMFGLPAVPPEGAVAGVAAFCDCARADVVNAAAATTDDVPRRTLRRLTLLNSLLLSALIAFSCLRPNAGAPESLLSSMETNLMVSLTDH